ncbi:MAG: beta-aspartyl-peptidase [Rubricoccaceae bacterium]|nr:beta-aspartyl-peptidase [Rubricoccaceae bacterium]
MTAPSPPTAPSLTLLLDAELYAPEPLGRGHVLLGGGRVLHVGAEPPEIRGVPVEAVDLGGRRVVPGLVDAHVHVTGGGGEAGPHTRAPAPALSHYTTAGVTTVVGLLGTDDLTRNTAGLLARVRALRAEGLTAFFWTGGYHLPPTTLTGTVRGDIVHLAECIGFGELAISDHRSSQPTFEQVAHLASECHVAGLMSGKAGVLHLHLGDGERGLALLRRMLDETELPPRTVHPTHVNRRRALFDEALALAERGVTVDVTAFPPEEAGEDEVEASEAVGRYLDSGLAPERLTVSSDGGGCLPHFDPQGELVQMGFATSGALADLLRRLLDAGRPLESVLPPFTQNPARALRLARKGRLAPGADADLVVLDADHGIADVMARGRWMVRDGRPVVPGLFESSPSPHPRHAVPPRP